MNIVQQMRPDGSFVMTLAGEMDVATVPQLRDIGLDLMAMAGWTGFLVDMSGVTFIDSCGLSALIAFRNAAEALGVPFALVDPSARVMKTLRVTGLDGLFPTKPSECTPSSP